MCQDLCCYLGKDNTAPPNKIAAGLNVFILSETASKQLRKRFPKAPQKFPQSAPTIPKQVFDQFPKQFQNSSETVPQQV